MTSQARHEKSEEWNMWNTILNIARKAKGLPLRGSDENPYVDFPSQKSKRIDYELVDNLLMTGHSPKQVAERIECSVSTIVKYIGRKKKCQYYHIV